MEKLIYLHYNQYQYCILKKNLLGGIFVFLVSYICIYVYNINPVDILKGNFVSQTIQFMSTVVINFDTWSVQTPSMFWNIHYITLDVFKGGWVIKTSIWRFAWQLEYGRRPLPVP
jgi:hypothetical protein